MAQLIVCADAEPLKMRFLCGYLYIIQPKWTSTYVEGKHFLQIISQVINVVL